VAHPVTWFQISGKDGAALEAFYKEIFDWKMTPSPDGSMQMVEAQEGGIPGGVGASQDGASSVAVYANVDDIAEEDPGPRGRSGDAAHGAPGGHGMDRRLQGSSGQLGRPVAALAERGAAGEEEDACQESAGEEACQGRRKEEGSQGGACEESGKGRPQSSQGIEEGAPGKGTREEEQGPLEALNRALTLLDTPRAA
jgi:hypothetical protein